MQYWFLRKQLQGVLCISYQKIWIRVKLNTKTHKSIKKWCRYPITPLFLRNSSASVCPIWGGSPPKSPISSNPIDFATPFISSLQRWNVSDSLYRKVVSIVFSALTVPSYWRTILHWWRLHWSTQEICILWAPLLPPTILSTRITLLTSVSKVPGESKLHCRRLKLLATLQIPTFIFLIEWFLATIIQKWINTEILQYFITHLGTIQLGRDSKEDLTHVWKYLRVGVRGKNWPDL